LLELLADLIVEFVGPDVAGRDARYHGLEIPAKSRFQAVCLPYLLQMVVLGGATTPHCSARWRQTFWIA
jgi:hypothetical protein